MQQNDTATHLHRDLSLPQATAINMIDMVGIGPFITLSFIAGLMQGPMSIFAWLIGALLAYMDGCVWAELGAKYPAAGGSYIFLQKLYGNKWGKLMAFLFIFQTIIQAPLVVASGSIGFSQYLSFLIPLEVWQQKMISGGLVLALVALLYRGIKSIGKISVVFWIITAGTIVWLIVSGIPRVNMNQAFALELSSQTFSIALFAALGQSSLKAVYSYLGYYNVCHLGGEIKNPEKNIPRSMFISITGIAILYLTMQTMVMGVLPWQKVAASGFVVSDYFETIYNHTVGQIATVLVLCIAIASLFSVLLGYSRVPYAAAVNGDFFSFFGKLHPRHKFPHVSLLVLGGLAFVFSLLFRMKDVITAIIVMRILIQFVAQAVGVIWWRIKSPDDVRPFKMPLFPLPAILSIIIWLFIFFTSGWEFISFAFGIIILGVILFYIKERRVFTSNR
ncbi:MAG TPA: APC family permease [Flavipsychrobacter sp.]|nr:APC family permease [Flavipsychrobacter sp.]